MMNMRRGTTPTIEIGIPTDINVADSKALFISISQNKSVVIEKKLSEVSIVNNKVTVELTQEDTLKLKPNISATIQIRFVLSTNRAFASQIKSIDISEVLKEGKI